MSAHNLDTPLLAAIEALLPDVLDRVEEIEAGRAVPPDLVGKLEAAGAFRMLLPRDLGGLGLSVLEAMDVVEKIATADGSTAWTTMIAAGFANVWVRFPETLLREVFRPGADVLARGSLTPRAVATRVEGGYVLNGRAPLASGCYKHDWVFVGCAIVDGTPVQAGTTVPDLGVALLATRDVKFLDTWHALGLRATASNDIVIDERFVPAERMVPLVGAMESNPSPLGRLPILLSLSGPHCALVIGLVASVLDDIARLAHGRRTVFNPAVTMADDLGAQQQIGLLSTRLRACRTLIWTEMASIWQYAVDGFVPPELDRARFRSAVAFVHNECVAIADEAYALAGTSVLYDSSSLQRRWRDLHTAGQHVIASPQIHTAFGALLFGTEPLASLYV